MACTAAPNFISAVLPFYTHSWVLQPPSSSSTQAGSHSSTAEYTLNMLYACGCSLTAAASVARIYWRGTRRGQRWCRRGAAVEEDLLSSLDLLSQEPWLPKFFLFFCTPQRICACGILLVLPPLLGMASNNQDVGVAADDDFNDDDADAFQSYYHG